MSNSGLMASVLLVYSLDSLDSNQAMADCTKEMQGKPNLLLDTLDSLRSKQAMVGCTTATLMNVTSLVSRCIVADTGKLKM